MDLILSRPFKLGKMPPTWALIVARGPLKGRCEGVGFESVKEARSWATNLGHIIVGKEKSRKGGI